MKGGCNPVAYEEGSLLTVKEVAKRLNVSPRSIWTRIAKGELPAPIRIGRLSRWRWETILKWIEEKEAEAAREQERITTISS